MSKLNKLTLIQDYYYFIYKPYWNVTNYPTGVLYSGLRPSSQPRMVTSRQSPLIWDSSSVFPCLTWPWHVGEYEPVILWNVPHFGSWQGHWSDQRHVMLTCPFPGHGHFAHLVKVASARFLLWKFLFPPLKWLMILEGDSLRRGHHPISPWTFAH